MPLPDDDPRAGVAEWVVTYGDMMSLLLTFFIMLVSLSELKQDKGKLRAALDAIREAFGADVGESGVPGWSLQRTSAHTHLNSTGVRSEGGLKRAGLNSAGRNGPNRTVQRINHGTVVTRGGVALFDAYAATLSEDARQALDLIASKLLKRANRVIVRGHASPDEALPRQGGPPAGGPQGLSVGDPWDLSYARAQAVAEHLIAAGIDRGRVLVSAAGTTEPRVRPRDRSAQQQNRRVDVFAIESYISRPRPSSTDE
ncbi:MAG TPA: flagellar motor protein MotB [Planctomycetaceae bacterium]|nr:flagellar motor protein MotB [Planctomycetaceae bacterium]